MTIKDIKKGEYYGKLLDGQVYKVLSTFEGTKHTWVAYSPFDKSLEVYDSIIDDFAKEFEPVGISHADSTAYIK